MLRLSKNWMWQTLHTKQRVTFSRRKDPRQERLNTHLVIATRSQSRAMQWSEYGNCTSVIKLGHTNKAIFTSASAQRSQVMIGICGKAIANQQCVFHCKPTVCIPLNTNSVYSIAYSGKERNRSMIKVTLKMTKYSELLERVLVAQDIFYSILVWRKIFDIQEKRSFNLRYVYTWKSENWI